MHFLVDPPPEHLIGDNKFALPCAACEVICCEVGRRRGGARPPAPARGRLPQESSPRLPMRGFLIRHPPPDPLLRAHLPRIQRPSGSSDLGNSRGSRWLKIPPTTHLRGGVSCHCHHDSQKWISFSLYGEGSLGAPLGELSTRWIPLYTWAEKYTTGRGARTRDGDSDVGSNAVPPIAPRK
jgi:hypothetical protein